MSYVVIWLQACLHWRCAYFQTLSWNDTIFVVDWDILYKLCGSANKWSKGFVFSGKIWWQFVSSNKACSKHHTRSTTTPKYALTQRLVLVCFVLSSSLDNRKLFRFRGRRGKFAEQNIAGSFFGHIILGRNIDWEWSSDRVSNNLYLPKNADRKRQI